MENQQLNAYLSLYRQSEKRTHWAPTHVNVYTHTNMCLHTCT